MDQVWTKTSLHRESGALIGPLTSTSFRAGDQIRTGDPHLGKVFGYWPPALQDLKKMGVCPGVHYSTLLIGCGQFPISRDLAAAWRGSGLGASKGEATSSEGGAALGVAELGVVGDVPTRATWFNAHLLFRTPLAPCRSDAS